MKVASGGMVRAVDLEARLGDLLPRARDRGLDLVLEELADLAGERIDLAREHDHRVGGSRDGRGAAFDERLAGRGVLELRAGDGRLRHLRGTGLAEHGLHERVRAAQLLDRGPELAAERRLLEVVVDRRRREQPVLEDLEVRVDVLLEPLLVRLLHLGRVAHDLAGDLEQPRAREAHQELVGGARRRLLLGRRDRGPGVPARGLELGVARHARAQLLLLGRFRGHRLRVDERAQPSLERLLAVLEAEDLRLRPSRLLGAARGVLAQHGEAPLDELEAQRQLDVAHQLELGLRIEARGRAGVARDEDEVAVRHPRRREREVRLRLRGLAVLVGPYQADVDVVAGEGEVVGVAAKKCDLLLRSKHQPHIRVLLVAVQVELATLVELDHVAAQAGGRIAVVLDLRDRRLAGLARLPVGHLRRDRSEHLAGHVLDADQDVDLVARAGGFLGTRLGVEAVLDVVVLGARDVLDAAEADVMVRDHEPVRGDEGARAAVHEAHRGLSHAVEPLLRGLEAVLVLELADRRIVEGPHALLGRNRGGEERQGDESERMHRCPGHGRPSLSETPDHKPVRLWP